MQPTDENEDLQERRRMVSLERKADMEMIAQLMAKEIATLMQSRFTIPSEKHQADHQFLEEIRPWLDLQMKREKAVCNLCAEMLKRLVKGGVWALMLYVGYRLFTGQWPNPEQLLK